MLGLTKKTDYALIALSRLAEDADAVVSAREIADRFDISLALLMNVLKQLSAAGLVRSVAVARRLRPGEAGRGDLAGGTDPEPGRPAEADHLRRHPRARWPALPDGGQLPGEQPVEGASEPAAGLFAERDVGGDC